MRYAKRLPLLRTARSLSTKPMRSPKAAVVVGRGRRALAYLVHQLELLFAACRHAGMRRIGDGQHQLRNCGLRSLQLFLCFSQGSFDMAGCFDLCLALVGRRLADLLACRVRPCPEFFGALEAFTPLGFGGEQFVDDGRIGTFASGTLSGSPRRRVEGSGRSPNRWYDPWRPSGHGFCHASGAVASCACVPFTLLVFRSVMALSMRSVGSA